MLCALQKRMNTKVRHPFWDKALVKIAWQSWHGQAVQGSAPPDSLGKVVVLVP